MADKLAVIQEQATIKALQDIDAQVKLNIENFLKLKDSTDSVSNALKSGMPKEFMQSAKDMPKILEQLAKAQKNIEDLQARVNKVQREGAEVYTKLSKETAVLREQKRLLNKEAKDQAQITIQEQQLLNASLGLYNKVQLKLNALTVKYNELAIKKQLGVKLSSQEEKSLERLQTKILKYDQALKGVDASVGKHQRNVGNYKSGFNELGSSINQLTREMPAFANSMQTGFMAISNNLPILFDAIGNIQKKNAILRAEGKQTQSTLLQIARGVLSWGTALSLGVTLLTLYGPELVKFTKDLFKSGSAIDSVTDSLKKNNEVMADNIAQSKAEFNKLKNEWDSLSGSLKSKQKFIEDNKDAFHGLGVEVKNVADAERLLGGQTPAFIEVLKLRAKAASQYQLAIEEYKKSALSEGEGEKTSSTIKSGINTLSQTLFGKDVFDRLKVDMRNASVIANEQGDAFMDSYTKLSNEADDLFDKLGLKRVEKEKKVKDESRKVMRDYLRDLEAWRDTQLAINEIAFVRLKKSEEDYLKTNFDINAEYLKKKISYLKGKSAEERKLRAQAQLDLAQLEKKHNKEIFDLYMNRLNKQSKLDEDKINKAQKTAQSNEYINEEERLNKLIAIQDELIKAKEKYYDKQIALAIKTNQEIIYIEQERDKVLGDLEDERFKLLKDRINSLEKDLKYSREIEDAVRKTKDSEERIEIINNLKLSYKQKQYQLEKDSLQTNIEGLKIDRERLKADLTRLESKYVKSQDDIKNIQLLTASVAELDLKITEAEKGLRNFDIKHIAEGFAPIVDFISKGFQDMGLNRIGDEFTSIYQRILTEGEDFAMSAEDIFKASASVIADFGSQFVEQQKQRTISALDEQLKHSQEMTDLEVGFIMSRIQALDMIQEKTQEEVDLRNALEDEARVLKEQQLQREKQIAEQKARAEQRASASQALINGGVAATKTLAEMGFVTGIPFALASLAFGALQAGLIMSRNPVPQYYVGTDNAQKGWALTQERGAELHTDKHGNIKTFGNNRGSQMTWMDAGDKVYTARETKDILKMFNDAPKIGDNILSGSLMTNFSNPMVVNNTINSKEVAKYVGQEYERVAKKFDKPYFNTIDGVTIKYESGKNPIIVNRESYKNIKARNYDRN